MMIEPKIFLIGESELNSDGLRSYLNHIGTKFEAESEVSSSENLIEIMGRMCYRSYEPLMNKNVTKIRDGNKKYIENIIKSHHGSVLEHSVTNWIFSDVSRVFTHELVRHRAGTAFSQESLRFVRLEELGFWLPEEARTGYLRDVFEKTFKNMSELQIEMAKALKLDEIKDFHTKKQLTSLMRRLAPDGLATTIGVSFNLRALRHVIEYRTAESAEAEIRFVFDKVAEISVKRWPNVFQDFKRNELGEWKTENSKI